MRPNSSPIAKFLFLPLLAAWTIDLAPPADANPMEPLQRSGAQSSRGTQSSGSSRSSGSFGGSRSSGGYSGGSRSGSTFGGSRPSAQPSPSVTSPRRSTPVQPAPRTSSRDSNSGSSNDRVRFVPSNTPSSSSNNTRGSSGRPSSSSADSNSAGGSAPTYQPGNSSGRVDTPVGEAYYPSAAPPPSRPFPTPSTSGRTTYARRFDGGLITNGTASAARGGTLGRNGMGSVTSAIEARKRFDSAATVAPRVRAPLSPGARFRSAAAGNQPVGLTRSAESVGRELTGSRESTRPAAARGKANFDVAEARDRMRSRRLASPESGALVSTASNGIAQATRAVVSAATRPLLGAGGSTVTASAFGGYGTTSYPPVASATSWGSFGYWDSKGCYYSPYSSWWGWSFGWSSGWGFYAGWNWNYPYCYSPYGYSPSYPYYGYSPYSWYYPTVVNHYIYEDDYDDNQVTVNVYGGGQVGEGVYADPIDGGVTVDVYPDAVASPPIGAAGGATQAPAADQLGAAAMRYLELGDTAFSELRFADAVHFYARAIEFEPDRGMLHLVLADALFATADYHYAAFSIRRALQLEPELVAAPVDKHQFYADPLEFDRQLAALELYHNEHPNDADGRLVLALNQLFGGRPEAAMKLLESAPTQVYGETNQASALILQSAKLARWGAAPPTEAKW